MLISHAYKFIFIKTTKTAGTSLEIELAKLMDRKDIVTPISPPHPGHRPRNHRRLWMRRYWNHMPAREVRAIVGPAVFDSYFKFAVEREPVDKCISHYSMLRNSPAHNRETRDLTWPAYVERGRFPTDHGKYLDGEGALLVDRILRYENLNDEMDRLGQQLGFRFPGLRATAKTGFREDPPVTDRDRASIYDAFAASAPFTGYRMVEAAPS